MNDKLKTIAISSGVSLLFGFIVGWAIFFPTVEKSNRTIDELEGRIVDLGSRIVTAQKTVDGITGQLQDSRLQIARATGQINLLRGEIIGYQTEIDGYREEIKRYRSSIDDIRRIIGKGSEGIVEAIGAINSSEKRIRLIIAIISEIEKRISSFESNS